MPVFNYTPRKVVRYSKWIVVIKAHWLSYIHFYHAHSHPRRGSNMLLEFTLVPSSHWREWCCMLLVVFSTQWSEWCWILLLVFSSQWCWILLFVFSSQWSEWCSLLLLVFSNQWSEWCGILLLVFSSQCSESVVKEHNKYDHIKPPLSELHWLPIEGRIRHKIAVLTLKAVSTSKLSYLAELVSTHTPARELTSSSRQPNELHVPNVRTTFGSLSFSTRCSSSMEQSAIDSHGYCAFTRNI